jgi:hypothetical protein
VEIQLNLDGLLRRLYGTSRNDVRENDLLRNSITEWMEWCVHLVCGEIVIMIRDEIHKCES